MHPIHRFAAGATLVLLFVGAGREAAGGTKPREVPRHGLATAATAASCDVGLTSSLCIPVDSTFSVVAFGDTSCSLLDPNDPCHRNDDSFTAAIPLPFTFHLYGQAYTSVYVNNNGNLSFGNGYCTFTPTGFPVSGFPMVAPFWADVDTRAPASGVAHYRLDAHKLVVAWDHVGYFDQQADKLNTFEVILTDGADPAVSPGNNVCFCFGDMQWTTGSASEGVGGFGGAPATAGVNAGDGIHFFQIGRFDHAGTDYDGPGGANDGVGYLAGQRFCANVGGQNVPPVASGFPVSLVDSVCVGDTLVLNTSFAAPELDQAAVTTVALGGLANATVSTISGNLSTQRLVFRPTATQAGTHVVRYVSVDNGVPPDTTTMALSIVVTNCRRCLPSNHAPQFVPPTPACGSTLQAVAGQAMTLQVSASDADSLDVVTLSAAGVPATAAPAPALPATGNPAGVMLSWTPAISDTGTRVLGFVASDGCDSATCAITVRVISQAACPRSAEDWANHRSAWPADSLRLGGRAYGPAALARLLEGGRRAGHERETDAAGMRVGAQLVAAKLNRLAGANTRGADSLVARADSLVGDRTLPGGIRCGERDRDGASPADAGEHGPPPGANDCARWLRQVGQVADALERFNHGDMTPECHDDSRHGDDRGDRRSAAPATSDPATGATAFSADARPNPFRGTTVIAYSLPEDADVRIAVYDLQGRELRVLAAGRMSAGRHEAAWDGTDSSGRRMETGVYFYRATAGPYTSGRKLVIRQ